MFRNLTNKLFLKMCASRNVVPLNAKAVEQARAHLDSAHRALLASGSLNDGTTPNALKRHITRKLTYSTYGADLSLSRGVWTGN